jgi:hypothetical protein
MTVYPALLAGVVYKVSEVILEGLQYKIVKVDGCYQAKFAIRESNYRLATSIEIAIYKVRHEA